MKLDQKISCVVPAFNEEKNILRVLTVLKDFDWIDEVIVVDDHSQDKSVDKVKSLKSDKIKLLIHSKNKGKGAALATGVREAKHDLLIFLDADLIGLKPVHIKKILAPIIFTGEADLCLGVFALKDLSTRATTKFANRMFPSITGQRAILRKHLPSLQEIEKSRYGVDLLITKKIVKKRRAVIKLEGLSQVAKEEKTVITEAIKARIKMYQEISKTAGLNF